MNTPYERIKAHLRALVYEFHQLQTDARIPGMSEDDLLDITWHLDAVMKQNALAIAAIEGRAATIEQLNQMRNAVVRMPPTDLALRLMVEGRRPRA